MSNTVTIPGEVDIMDLHAQLAGMEASHDFVYAAAGLLVDFGDIPAAQNSANELQTWVNDYVTKFYNED